MSIQHTILGFLSWQPLTGYDLKKRIAASETLYWSGNSNQIYRALLALHEQGLVTREVEQQADAPPRKIYAINEAGLAELRRWLLAEPELPQLRNTLHVRLAWAQPLTDGELAALLAAYEDELSVRARMLRERRKRQAWAPRRSARETLVWDALESNRIAYYEQELAWARDLRQAIAAGQAADAGAAGAEEST